MPQPHKAAMTCSIVLIRTPFLFDSSSSGGVGDVIRKGFYDRCSLQVDPSEFDPESRFGGIDRHRYIKSGVQTFPLKGYGSI